MRMLARIGTALLLFGAPTPAPALMHGDLDPTFDGDGIVTTNFRLDGPGGSAFAMGLQGDGKIISAGTAGGNLALTRHNLDGTLDTMFGSGGRVVVGPSGWVNALALQGDGKIVAAGVTPQGSGEFLVVRFLADGTLDSSFGTGGYVTTAIGSGSDSALAVAIQPDGKIIAAGKSWEPQQVSALVRYHADGSLDASFGTGGIVTTSVGPSSGISDIAVLSDGKIVAAGHTTNGGSDFAVLRYHANGLLDSSFDGDGVAVTEIGTMSSAAYALAVQADGKLVAAGSRDTAENRELALVRYDVDGSLDTSFDGDGIVTTTLPNAEIHAVAMQMDGKIAVAGRSGGVDLDFFLARYNSDGSLDAGFASGGVLDGGSGAMYAVAQQPDGKLVAAGGGAGILVVRCNSDGSFDTSFGGDGQITTGVGMSADSISAVVRQPDGKLVAAGRSGNEAGIARYNVDGSLDESFGDSGVTVTSIGSMVEIAAIALQDDGKIVAVGSVTDDSLTEFVLLRYHPDGTLDPGFGGDGIVTTDPLFGGNNSPATGIAVAPGGKIVLVGSGSSAAGNSDFVIARYNPDGSLDSTFDDDGIVATDINANSLDYAGNVVLQANGKILVAGGSLVLSTMPYEVRVVVVRYNSDGSLDSTFDGDGISQATAGGLQNLGFAKMALQSDGKIIVTGEAFDGSAYDFSLVRFNANGGVDTTFGSDGIVVTDLGGQQEFARAAIVQGDDKIVAARYTIDGTSQALAVVRYTANGTLDASFADNGVLTIPSAAAINALALQPDGYLIAAGSGLTVSFDFLLTRIFVTECGNAVIDAGEQCDLGLSTGATGACCAPSCLHRPSSYACRPAASACDLAEQCTGASPICPANAFAPSGTACDSDVCSTDACNGAGTCVVAPTNPGVVCRAAAGGCDTPEHCNGTSSQCPANAMAPGGTLCRAAAGVCDVAEVCTGVDAACPPNQFSTAVCRVAAGVCDVAEWCDGGSSGCPANGFAPSGTTCRAAANECDVPEACSGNQPTCPADQSVPDGTACAPDGDACTPDQCSGGVCTHADSDGDAIGDLCDNCAAVVNADQHDADCDAPSYFASGACAGNPPASRAGCCDGGDLCDPCPAQRNNANCDPQATAAGTIGAAGGTLSTPDGAAQLVVPAGALPIDTSISATSNGPATSFNIDRGTTNVVSFSMRPEGIQFAAPVTITFKWDDRDNDGIVDRGTCVGGGDGGQSCDTDADCGSGDCTVGGGPDEAALVLKRNGDRFSAAGFGTSAYRCDDHLAGACATASADCSDPPGAGQASVARCCNRAANTWTFQTCSFSEFFLGLTSGDLVPGKGDPATDCMAEWSIRNPLNEPWLDRRGVTNFKQECTDGDPTCDFDGSTNGVCALDVAVCLNLTDVRLVDPDTGLTACTPGSVATWQIKKPFPDSIKPYESANALAMRDAVAALTPHTISGPHQDVVTFNAAVTTGETCTSAVRVNVPLRAPGKRGKAVFKMQSRSGATKDTDKLVLRCLPALP